MVTAICPAGNRCDGTQGNILNNQRPRGQSRQLCVTTSSLSSEGCSQLGHLSRPCHQVDPRFLLSVALTSHTSTALGPHDPPPPSLLQRYPEGGGGFHAHHHPQGEFKMVKLRLRSGTALVDQPLPHSCCPALPESPGLPCSGPALVGGRSQGCALAAPPTEAQGACVLCHPTSRHTSSLFWARNRTFKTQNSRKFPKCFLGCSGWCVATGQIPL